MKKTTIIILLILAPLALFAEDTNKTPGLDLTFRALQANQVILAFTDTFMSLKALQTRDDIVEANPIARMYIDNTGLTIALGLVTNALLTLITSKLYKTNRVLGLSVIIAMNIVRGYVVFSNLKTLR